MSSRALKYLLNKVGFYGDIWLHFGKAELSHQPEVTGLVYKKLNCELAGRDWCSPQPHGTVGQHMDREDVVCGLFQGKTLQMSIFFLPLSAALNPTCKHIISLSFLKGGEG